MAITTPCYCSREDTMRAIDFRDSAAVVPQVDRAIQSTARLIEGHLHRVFYPITTTYKWDWPNWSYAPTWRLRTNQWDIVSLTQVQSPSGTTISLSSVILYPVNRLPGWPYTRVELDRSSTAAWSTGSTPQNSILLTGTFGFTADTESAGQLAAQISSTSATTITVSDASLLGVGDLIVIDSERLLITERAVATTTQTNLSGVTTASAGDYTLTVTDGTQIHVGEVLLIDSEQLYVTGINGNAITVRRAFNGTVLATHSAATTLYAYRLLTVARGQLGSTAATHTNGTAVNRHAVPSLIRDLAIAESVNRVLQETGGYSHETGEGGGSGPAPGGSLPDLWDEVVTLYGRKARQRAI